METTDNSPHTQPNLPKPAAKTFPGIVLRLILVFSAGCLVGAVIYFAASGWVPYLDQRIFQPLDTNQARVVELQATQDALNIQISSLQATLDAGQPGIGLNVEETLAQFSEDLTYMQTEVDSNTYFAATLSPAMLSTVSAHLDSNTRFLSAIATAQMKEAGNRQEIDLLRSLEILTWAHQYLLHDNYGLAEDALEIARDNLSSIITRVPAKQRVVVFEMLKLVEECLADLPSRPAVAAEKLQLAWQMGVNEFPNQSWYETGLTITPTPYLTPSPTPN